MKKLLFAACLSLVAFVLVPIATASAIEFNKLTGGHCAVEGTAKFETLSFNTEEEKAYEFESKPGLGGPAKGGGFHCEGTAENTKGETAKGPWLGLVTVNTAGNYKEGEEKPKGDLSCASSKSKKHAKIHIDAKNAKGDEVVVLALLLFKTTKFGELEVGVYNKGLTKTAEGTANFTEPGNAEEKAKTLAECVEGKLKKLNFFAEILGTIEE
jgi:hypothetical protein